MRLITSASASSRLFCRFIWDRWVLLGLGKMQLKCPCLPHAEHILGLDCEGSYGLARFQTDLACILGGMMSSFCN